MCDSVNHTRFLKEVHLPDWSRRDNKVTKGDRVDYESSNSEHAVVRRTTVWDKSNTSVHRVGKENAFSVFDRSEFLCVESCGHSERIKSETLTIRHCTGQAIIWAVVGLSPRRTERGCHVSQHVVCGEKYGVSPTTSVLTCHLLHHSSVLIVWLLGTSEIVVLQKHFLILPRELQNKLRCGDKPNLSSTWFLLTSVALHTPSRLKPKVGLCKFSVWLDLPEPNSSCLI